MRMFITAFVVALAMAQPSLLVFAAVSIYLYYRFVDKEQVQKCWNWMAQPMKVAKKVKIEEKKEDSGYQGFTLTKDIQEANVKRYMKPGFQDDPVWQAQVKEIHKIMDENRRRNEAELAKEEEDRLRGVTK